MLVVHAHHVLFALGQVFDRLDQSFAHAPVLQQGQRVGVVVDHVAVEVVVVAFVAAHVLQVNQLGTTHPAEQLLVSRQRQAHLLGNLAFVRRPAQRLLELAQRSLYRSLVTPVATAHPVVAAQLIKHRTADSLRGEGLELHTLRRVEARQRVGQPDHPDLYQVIELDVRRQTGCNLIGQAVNEWRVLNNRAM